MRSPLILLCFLLSSCAVVEVAERPETLALCSAADVATTIYAISGGHGIEVNPLLSGSVNSHAWLKLIATKIAIVGLAWWAYDHWREQVKYGVVASSAITCGVAASNGLVILQAIRP